MAVLGSGRRLEAGLWRHRARVSMLAAGTASR
jgi:hypothetical protein